MPVSVRKGAVAVATVLAMFFVLASPASANTVGVKINSGTLVVDGNTFDLGPDAPAGPCPEKPRTISVTFSSPPPTWTITGTWSSQFEFPTGSGNWWQADFTVTSGSGSYGGSAPAYTLSGNLVVSVEISPISDGNCAKVKICTLTVGMALTAGSEYNGSSLPTANTGETATVNASTFAPIQAGAGGCSAPFNAWVGKSATLSSLVLEVL